MGMSTAQKSACAATLYMPLRSPGAHTCWETQHTKATPAAQLVCRPSSRLTSAHTYTALTPCTKPALSSRRKRVHRAPSARRACL